MIKILSELYNATFKKNRGVAAQGFIRPTLGQYFMTHKDFSYVITAGHINIIKPDGSNIRFGSGRQQLTEPGEYILTVDKDTVVNCKLWGGAGGGRNGGVGGHTYGEILLLNDTIYKIWVGGPGLICNSNVSGVYGGFGGGGLCGRTNLSTSYVGSGGGLTGLFLNTVDHNNSVLIAGGGAGGSIESRPVNGGNGGGITGGPGEFNNYKPVGQGGTQYAGGAAGTFSYHNTIPYPGGKLYGGNAVSNITQTYSGGGGGSGYYGGGAGSTNNTSGSAGGGGSSFINGSLVSNGETTRLNAYGGEVTNNNDLDYTNNAGNNSETDGNSGLFVLNILS